MEIKAIQSETEYQAAVAVFEGLDRNSFEAHAMTDQLDIYVATRRNARKAQAAARSIRFQAAAQAAYGNL